MSGSSIIIDYRADFGAYDDDFDALALGRAVLASRRVAPKRAGLPGWHGSGTIYLYPEDAGVFLARSSGPNARLTHIVRWVGQQTDGERWYKPFCDGCPSDTPVAIDDATGVCARCFALAERMGEPTFGLTPTTGYQASGGKRWKSVLDASA